MPLLRYATFWTLFLLSQSLAGQHSSKSYTYTLGADISKGFIMKHSQNIGHLAISHPSSLQIFVNKHTFGKKYCEQLYNYPDLGLALNYINYLNPILGKTYALSTYMDIPAIQWDKAKVRFKLGTGLAYHTRPYHPTKNYHNITLGTPLTLMMVAGIKYDYALTDIWNWGLAASIMHFSNGAFSKPNTGINLPNLDLIISRKITPVFPEKKVWPDQKDLYQGIYYYLGASTGLKEMEYGGDKFSFFNLHFLAAKRFNPISALNLGLDAFFDNGLKALIEQEIKEAPPDYRRAGIVIGHELFYDRLSLLTQIGTYIYRPYQAKYSSLYQRYGLRYSVTSLVSVSMTLKAHGGQAEYMEWGLGFNF